ncbi:NAD-dependent epimerase/dehydratase family protein [Haloarcula salinisoli]|uniref:NAD(P)-dependent oxidoreductase n=1 Tax=Haloarcula salinisoli TaxID=2487746 RepID=A0A8J7YKN9_9EURY|nr:NAD(P)-dependent oxidoreductase [Halomicroarcula salinisoli]MBX0305086.1 NAD(P)-dependent oxidoreductase [Halomicroarcula salinisoli]
MELVVFGGNGFIGRRVCRRAVEDGHEVRSIARSGPPAPDQRGPWADAVTWHAANVFAPNEYREALDGADAVVHSIGIIEESPNEGVTFERVNGDSAIITALESERAGVERFVYISSVERPPWVREAYITARRRAERAIADLGMATTVLRPGAVYGPDQPHFPSVLNRLLTLVGEFDPVAERLGEGRPLDVETVGEAVYEAAVGVDSGEPPLDAQRIAARAS